MEPKTWGGARDGAGRPRTRVTLLMPAAVIAQLEAIARREQVPLEEVIKEAVLDFLERYQDEHV